MPQPDDDGGCLERILADLIAEGEVVVNGYKLSGGDCAVIVKALRDRARWMTADIYSGERRKGRAK